MMGNKGQFNEENIDKSNMDICVKRLAYSIIGSKKASNNWRKYHGLPMWRLKG